MAISNATDGLDLTAAQEWIYPINFPVREYQRSIVEKALFSNTLVSLPTGLGKTFIAAVVMYNFHRWYPSHKVVFMAHSRPLVSQQIAACSQIMGISESLMAELNGNVSGNNRKVHWDKKRIFFLTPQVFNNDLINGLVSPESIRCVVVDEAHKAVGNQAFCQAIRSLRPFNSKFRVLALSATPGDNTAMCKLVIENLMIAHLEIRTEQDDDIKIYLHEKKVENIIVNLDSKITEFKAKLSDIQLKYLRNLESMKAITPSFGSLSSFMLVLKQKNFIANPTVPPERRGLVLLYFSLAISLFKAMEVLVTYGLRSFHHKLLALKSGDESKTKVHCHLAKDESFLELCQAVENYIGKDKDIPFDPDISMARLQDELDAQADGDTSPFVYSHPKFVMLEEIVTQHFHNFKEKDETTRVIIFCKSRPCTGEICNFLNRFRPLIKPMVLIGQGKGTGGSTTAGLKQEAQIQVMRKFRNGYYNTLVATCVGEEGLDIGEVDLIVNFDATKDSKTQIQRCGRTGRKRDGRIINLLTEGKEHHDYNTSVDKAKTICSRLLKAVKHLPLYQNSPRLIPDHIQPKCQELYLKQEFSPNEKIATVQSDNPGIQNQSKTKLGEKAGGRKIGKGSLKGKKANNSRKLAKYDIRSALSPTTRNDKRKFEDDSSSSLFESRNITKLKKSDTSFLKSSEEIQIPDVICLDENSNDHCGSVLETSKTIDSTKGKQLIQKILNDSFDAEACSVMETLSMNEICHLVASNLDLVKMPKKFHKLPSQRVIHQDESSDENSSDLLEVSPPTSPAVYQERSVSIGSDVMMEVVENPLKGVTIIENHHFGTCLKPEGFERSENESMSDLQLVDIVKSRLETVSEVGSSKSTTVNEVCVAKKPAGIRDSFRGKAGEIVSDSHSDVVSQLTRVDVTRSPLQALTTNPQENYDSSPSLVTVDRKPSKVKKSLKFFEPLPPVPPVCDFQIIEMGSDEDLFADEEMRLSQMPKTSPPKKLSGAPTILANQPVPSKPEQVVDEDIEFLGVLEPVKDKSASFINSSNLTTGKTCQSTKSRSNSISCEPFRKNVKTAVVRPLGFEDSNDVWLSKENKLTPASLLPLPPRTKKTAVKTHQNTLEDFLSGRLCGKSQTCLKDPVRKTSFSSFDLFPDDFESQQSPEKSVASGNKLRIGASSVGSGRNVTPLQPRNRTLKQSTPVSNAPVFSLSDDELSDGAIEAIRAVEQAEKNLETIEKGYSQKKETRSPTAEMSDGELEALRVVEEFEKNNRSSEIEKGTNRAVRTHNQNDAVFQLWSSEDSCDVFESSREFSERRKSVKTHVKKRKMGKKRTKAENFLDKEAVLSGSTSVSSDENSSGLDEMESSFLDERLSPTQAPNVDMTAKYLATVKSPKVVPGAFKLPNAVNRSGIEVFSQVVQNDDDYEQDSFCVADVTETQEVELSELEIAEIILAGNKKRPKTKCQSEKKKLQGDFQRQRKRRRIVVMDSSSDEDEIVETMPSINSNNKSSTQCATTSPLIFVGSRTVSVAQDIIIGLRATHNYRVDVRSCLGADFILSWRMAINRFCLSDFCSGSPSTKTFIKESLVKLTSLFIKPVVVIEDDKNKSAPRTAGCYREMWGKLSARKVTRLYLAGLSMFFTKDKDETTTVIAKLAEKELADGHAIVTDCKASLEEGLRFYSLLPGVNLAQAANLSNKFSTITSFLSVCDCVGAIQREVRVSRHTAVQIYHAISSSPFSQ